MEKEIKITEEKIKEIIKEKLPQWFAEKLSRDYDNPLKDAVEEAIHEKEGVIKKVVNSVLAELLESKEFREELGKKVLEKVVKKGLEG